MMFLLVCTNDTIGPALALYQSDAECLVGLFEISESAL